MSKATVSVGKVYQSGKSVVGVQFGTSAQLVTESATIEEGRALLFGFFQAWDPRERLMVTIENAIKRAEAASDDDQRRLLLMAVRRAEECIVCMDAGDASNAVIHALLMADNLRVVELAQLTPAIATDYLVRKGGRDVQAKAKAHRRELAAKRWAVIKAATKDAGPVHGRIKRIARAAGCSWAYAKRVLAEIDTTAPAV